MKESTYKKIFHNWKRGKDTVLRSYKYSILFAPLINEWYFIRADKNGEDWSWYKPCPDYICLLIDPLYNPASLHPDTIIQKERFGEGYTEMFKNELARKTETVDEGYSGLFEEEK